MAGDKRRLRRERWRRVEDMRKGITTGRAVRQLRRQTKFRPYPTLLEDTPWVLKDWMRA